MTFNSLGSSFVSFSQVVKPLFIQNKNEYVRELENYLENKYQGKAKLLYKGREALELALQLAALPQGAAVAINGFTCYAVYQAIVEQGLVVEYLDIDKTSLDFSVQTLQKAIKRNPKIKAVIVQNSLGFPAQVPEIKTVCEQHDLVLIEDLAHSVGTVYANGQEAGSVGDFVVFSFSQDKVIDSVAGGALIVRRQKFLFSLPSLPTQQLLLAAQLKDRFHPLFTWIIRKTYRLQAGKVLHWFFNQFKLLSRPMNDAGSGFHDLPAWQCWLALSLLKDLPQAIKHRQAIAQVYLENLPEEMVPAATREGARKGSYLRFPVLVSNRPALLAWLKNKHYHLADIWYDAPIGPRKYLQKTNYTHQCPIAEQITAQIINLPTHANVSLATAKALAELITHAGNNR